MNLIKLLVAGGIGATAVGAFGQSAPPILKAPPKPQIPKVATTIPAQGVHLETNVGSFKIKRGSEALNYGTLTMTFRGTVLVSNLKGTAVPTGGVELELSQPKFGKAVYHSKSIGKLVITGQFGGIQFFGSDMKAYYRGDGVIEMHGEFDKDLNTGTYWYDQKPSDKRFWGANGMLITPTPMASQAAPDNIRIKDVPAKP